MKTVLVLTALFALACGGSHVAHSGDAGATALDGGTSADAGAAEPDAGTEAPDAGHARDAGVVADAGTAGADAGTMVTLNSTGLTVSMGIQPNPPIRGRNAMTLLVKRRSSGAALTGATVAVTPWMPAHGHGSTSRPVVTEATDGRYDVANVVLQMAGSWELKVAITDNGRAETVTFNVSVR